MTGKLAPGEGQASVVAAPNLHTVEALQLIDVRQGVVMRPWQDADAPAIIDTLDRDPNIRQRVSLANGLNTTQDVLDKIERSQQKEDALRYVVEENGQFVGMVSLWRYAGYYGDAPEPTSYGFGYFLDPSARGRGLTVDSVRALMDVVVEQLPVDKFMSFCEDDNHDSIAVLTALGLQPTDTVMTEPGTGWAERRYEMPINNKGAIDGKN